MTLWVAPCGICPHGKGAAYGTTEIHRKAEVLLVPLDALT